MSATVAEDHAKCDALVAGILRNPKNAKPCCVKGCFACCSESVYASNAEADYLLELLSAEQKAEVATRVSEWLAKVRPILSQNMPAAIEYRRLDAPCPLLKDGLCSVYARRPFGCRTWFALGRPQDCNLPARDHQKFAVVPKEFFRYLGKPAAVDGFLVLDHLGILLAERLLGITVESGSRIAAKLPPDSVVM